MQSCDGKPSIWRYFNADSEHVWRRMSSLLKCGYWTGSCWGLIIATILILSHVNTNKQTFMSRPPSHTHPLSTLRCQRLSWSPTAKLQATDWRSGGFQRPQVVIMRWSVGGNVWWWVNWYVNVHLWKETTHTQTFRGWMVENEALCGRSAHFCWGRLMSEVLTLLTTPGGASNALLSIW